ncbi:MAG: aldo/keto reductase, partial [Shimia sp.]
MTDLRTLSGDAPSALCFGCMQFGGTADARAAREMYAACRAAGVNVFDTAHTYTEGQADRMLGVLVAGERDHVLIASKVAYTGGSGRETI